MSKDLKSITPQQPADFTPTLGNYTNLSPFRFWCQKVLPLVYDDSLSYYELLCKIVDFLNKTMEDVGVLHEDVLGLHGAYVELQGWVNNYFDSLDVQQEINNKLDEMAENGELAKLIVPIVTSIINPVIVDSVEDMVNTSKIYVLKTNGHIYTYNQGTWTDSGLVFGQINGAIMFKGRVTSDNMDEILPDLNDAISNSVYELNFFSGSSTIPKNSPMDHFPANTLVNVITYGRDDNGQRTQMWVDYSNATIYTRNTGGGVVWGNWALIKFDSHIIRYAARIIQANYEELLPDLNEAESNTVYELNFNGGQTQNLPSHLPFSVFPSNSIVYVITYGRDEKGQRAQMAVDYGNGFLYTRNTGAGLSWGGWKSIQYGNHSVRYTKRITQSNYGSELPDCNLANSNTVYELNFNGGQTENLPLNLPFSKFPDRSVVLLFTFGRDEQGQRIQICVDAGNGNYYSRNTGAGLVWQPWQTKSQLILNENDDIIGILSNTSNRKVIFQAGNYDIKELYTRHYGNDFWDNYSGYSTSQDVAMRGVPILRGVDAEFSGGANFVFSYTGENVNVLNHFACFALESGVTLNGLNLTCSGCREAIHDDFDNHIDLALTTVIKNCRINSNDRRCISAGFGRFMHYEIHDNIFISNRDVDKQTIAYHNNLNPNSKCTMSVYNNVISEKLVLQYYGNTTDITEVIVTNNLLGDTIDIQKSLVEPNDIVNIKLYKWNNLESQSI